MSITPTRGIFLAILTAASICSTTQSARANCAMPSTYYVTVEGSTVTVCPSNFEGRGCPDVDGMMRASETGTVRLADRCSNDAGPESCYVDECVPRGVYQYGFARPYECCDVCCSTLSYETATVTEELSPQCSRADAGETGDAGPDTGSPTMPPWGPRLICTYSGGGSTGFGGQGGQDGGAGSSGAGGASGSGGVSGGSGGTTSGEAGSSAGAGGSDDESSEGCSCTLPRTVSGTELILGANGMLVLLGLFLGRRRRS